MSVLHLEVCPICGADHGLVRQTTRSGGLSQVTYTCRECESVLLWLGDDLWLQGDRWAYQKVGREDRASLLHKPLKVEELRQLASQGPPSDDGETPVVSAWQASENGWEAVPIEEGGPPEPGGDPGHEAPIPGGDPWFDEPPSAPAREAEVSAEYEWLDARPAGSGEDEAALAQDAWFQEPSIGSEAGGGTASRDAWPGDSSAVHVDDFTGPPPEAAGGTWSDELHDEQRYDEPSSASPVGAVSAQPGGARDLPSKRRRSRGSPLLAVSVVLTMLCLFGSAATMIISTNLSGRTPQGLPTASPPPNVALSTQTPLPSAIPAVTGLVPNQPSAVEFQGVTAYVTGAGSHHVVGEVINRSGENLRFVEILASFYDGGGQLIATGSTFAEISVIQPGGAAPFRLVTLDPPPSLADYELRSDYVTSEAGPLGLDVLGHSASVGDNGRYQISGEVRNPHDFVVRFPEIVATFYNPSHQVVRVEVVFAQQETLQPGEVSAFEIVLADPPGDLHHYALQTEAVRD